MRMLFVFLAGLAMNPMVEASVGAEPTGGLTAAAAEPVRVFVLAGQSNMEGQSVAVVPAGPLERLQRVVLVLDLSHGELTSMQYHPSADWLAEHGYDTNLARCVHIPVATDLPTPRNIREQPWVVLHELAHAYHDQVLGFDDPRIRAAYEAFRRGGHGDQALLHDGTRTRHYGLTDPKEFFAEMTEAFFGSNDFQPFNRAELRTTEPAICDLLESVWREDAPATTP